MTTGGRVRMLKILDTLVFLLDLGIRSTAYYMGETPGFIFSVDV